MISLARNRPLLRVVDDQIGPPTYAPDIANALLRIAMPVAALSQACCIWPRRGRNGPRIHGARHHGEVKATGRAFRQRSKRFQRRNSQRPHPAHSMRGSLATKATQMFALGWTPSPEALEHLCAAVLARK